MRANLLTAAVRAGRRITPAGEWLLDNFYLIEEQIRTARRHLPQGLQPRAAAAGERTGGRACRASTTSRWRLIAHGDGRVDAESLARFIAAYQAVTPLKLGELWAVPIMLRLALIENLRRVASDVASRRRRSRPGRCTGPSGWCQVAAEGSARA